MYYLRHGISGRRPAELDRDVDDRHR